ncbi:MAG: hypothetical protein U0P82_04435 [Vicinamibacterales bacterium]
MTTQDKRSAALAVVERCAREVPQLAEATAVQGLVASLCADVDDIQGGPDDRPYFTRTMTRIAHVVRSHGWVDVATATLEWAMTRGALDGYVLSELAECHIARADLAAAEATLHCARSARLPTDAIYTSLVKAHARCGNTTGARAIFDRAQEEGAVTSFTYPALIAAYAATGNAAEARRVFECARRDGQLSPPAFAALASACVAGGDLDGVDVLLREATAAGHASVRLTLTAIRGWLGQRRFAEARRVLEQARASGMTDDACYVAIIVACHKAGRHREAKRVFLSAASDTRLGPDEHRRIKHAHTRTRRTAGDDGGRGIAA